MPKIALLIEFWGRAFHGWQYQDNAISVQQTLEEAWTRLTDETRRFSASSRTDAGVSARGLVCDVSSDTKIPVANLPYALNAQLPESLVVLRAREVPEDFSPRFQSIGKHYCYRFFRRAIPSAFHKDTTYHCPRDFDLSRAREVFPAWLGERDFKALMDQGSPVPSTVRRLDALRLREAGDILELHVLGSGFLYHMVRILAGTAMDLMTGRLTPEHVVRNFTKGDRTELGPTLPPQGLMLERVFFDTELFGGDDRKAYEELRKALGNW